MQPNSKIQENIKDKERLEEEIDFLQGYMNMGKSNIPLAATLSLEFGTTSVNHMLVWMMILNVTMHQF